MKNKTPILYTFRRCPYAIRARLALFSSHIDIEIREILLRDKPQQMLAISAKGTVPVFYLSDTQVIDESIDIVDWALTQKDPLGLLDNSSYEDERALIKENDNEFKMHLDHYKYAVRFPEKSAEQYRLECEKFLIVLDEKLIKNSFLFGDEIGLADLAIFPFIRQFAAVDRQWFATCRYQFVRLWLERWYLNPLFLAVMTKYDVWQPHQRTIFLTHNND